MKIGTKTFTRGNEITIITEPYELHGGMWQNGIDECGKVHMVPTVEQRQADITTAREERKEQQAGFARLKVLKSKV